MQYEISIPSYKRSKTLKEKTLALLTKHNINPDLVTIFVADQEEYDVYTKELQDTPYKKLVIGEVGIGAIRRFTQKYYPEGTYVMNFDDDLQECFKKIDDKTMIPVSNLEEEVIYRGFKACEENNAYMFGIYAAANPMFMKNRIAVGLYYCIGSCWGLITRHDNDLTVLLDDKEDFERTLQHYVKDGKVVRLDDITVKSKYYTEEGGMQVTRTTERILKSAENLVERFPNLCTMYIRGTTGHAELRLRDTNKKSTTPSASLDNFFN
jgi:hypothetical protein